MAHISIPHTHPSLQGSVQGSTLAGAALKKSLFADPLVSITRALA